MPEVQGWGRSLERAAVARTRVWSMVDQVAGGPESGR